jgi:hypothetical protein
VLLGSRDWAVCEAENGWSGVEKFEEQKPDVVVYGFGYAWNEWHRDSSDDVHRRSDNTDNLVHHIRL